MPVRQSGKRSRRNRSRSGNSPKQSFVGVLLTSGVAVILAGLGVAIWQFSPPGQDKATACLTDAAPPELVSILLDISDPLSHRQEADIRARLEEISNRIPTYGRIEVYALEEDSESHIRPIVTACNPGRGSETNTLIGNPRLVERKWKEIFENPVGIAITKTLEAKQKKNSPILEAIQSISINSLARADYRKSRRVLIIVSDFLQHTAAYSNYRNGSSFKLLRDSAYFARTRPDLRGVEVNMYYVHRDVTKRLQGPAHREFWNNVLSEAGASALRIFSVQG